MKILMIDDTKSPSSFYKADKIKFTNEEVVLKKNYSEGMDTLLSEGPWEILLIDYHLNEFSAGRNGSRILKELDRVENKIVKKVIIITSDKVKSEEMYEICKKLKLNKKIETFSVQRDI